MIDILKPSKNGRLRVWIKRVGASLASMIISFIVPIFVYTTDANGALVGIIVAATQSQDVLDTIYSVASGVPAVAYLLVALSLFFIYPLGKQQV